MKKAKSRLTPETKKIEIKKRATRSSSLKAKYLKHLPLLLLSLPFYIGTYFIFNNIYPDQIKNFILPNAFLPLQGILFFANFFLFSYLLLNTRRGLELAVFISVFIFLKLQGLINFSSIITTTLIILLAFELTITLSKRK